MRKELTDQLFADFPTLYAGKDEPLTQNLMGFGFECGDGWEPLIRKLSEQLTFLALAENSPVKAVQVKEKYGTLRFYVDGATEIMDACIEAAERRSGQTCEVCGERGSIRSGGWIQTLCAQHAYDSKRQISDWEAESLGVTDHVKKVET